MINKITLKISRYQAILFFSLYCTILFFAVFLTPNRYEGTLYIPKFIPLYYNIKRIHKPDGEYFWRYYIDYWGNILGNIILFLPLGYLLKAMRPIRKNILIIILGLSISLFIETVQYLLQIGVADIDDVILNTVGVVLGLYCYKVIVLKTD